MDTDRHVSLLSDRDRRKLDLPMMRHDPVHARSRGERVPVAADRKGDSRHHWAVKSRFDSFDADFSPTRQVSACAGLGRGVQQLTDRMLRHRNW